MFSGQVSAARAEDQGIKPHSPRSGHTSDLKISVLMATLPGVECYRVSAWTGWPGVCILLGYEMASLICSLSQCDGI